VKVFICKSPTPLQITVLTPQQNVQVHSLCFLSAYCKSHYSELHMLQNSSDFCILFTNLQHPGEEAEKKACILLHLYVYSMQYHFTLILILYKSNFTKFYDKNYNTTSIMGISGIFECFDFTLHKCCFWFLQHDIHQWHQGSLITNV
jgi:hypothetical protein